jgi:sugar lactone lactonase YvrE
MMYTLNLRILILALVSSLTAYSQPRQVITLAGGSGDGGSKSDASFLFSTAIATDGTGNVYIADNANRTVRKINISTGIVTKIAGSGLFGYSGDGGSALEASFGEPSGIAVDAQGNIYIADKVFSTIRKIDAQTGIITRIAGDQNGESGYTGDNAFAVSAKLFWPQSLTLDANGNLYFPDLGNHRIRMINLSTGIITTVAGNGVEGFSGDGGNALNASFSFPEAVAIDQNQNIYIADTRNARIRVVNFNTKVITTLAGNGAYLSSGDGGISTQASIDQPLGILFGNGNSLFFSEGISIRKINLNDGIISTLTGGSFPADIDGALNQAKFYEIRGLTLAPNGTLYSIDRVLGKIKAITSTTVSTFAGSGGFSGDGGLATEASITGNSTCIDGEGNIYIAEGRTHRIRKINSQTKIISTIAGDGTDQYGGDGGLAINAQLRFPADVIIDSDGNLVFSDGADARIRKIDLTSGIITTIAGIGGFGSNGDGGLAINASLYGPYGLALNSMGDLFFADRGNHKIRMINKTTGIITTIAGSGSPGFSGDNGLATQAMLNSPSKITFDSNDNLYIADLSNTRIRKVNYSDKIITTIAGPGNGIDNQPALTALRENLGPVDIAFDPQGHLLIMENYEVRVLDPSSGLIHTFAGKGKGYYGDGGTAAEAAFYFLSDLTFDSDGNILVTDSENRRIRKINAKAAQIILPSSIDPVTFGDAPFILNILSDSGLPITLTSNQISIATINGQQVTIMGAGSTTITASQAGNDLYLPATPVDMELLVNKAGQTITFLTLNAKTFGQAPFTVNASASSNLPVTLSADTQNISIANMIVTMVQPGKAIITASQPGNANYLPAQSIAQEFCINPIKPIVTYVFQPSTLNYTLTSSASLGNQWYLNNNAISGATEVTFTTSSDGLYFVKSSIEGCTSEQSDVTPKLITSIWDLENHVEIKVYPNPVANTIYLIIEDKISSYAQIVLNDPMGRKVKSLIGNTNIEIPLYVNELPEGIYFIKVSTEERNFTKKIILKR